MAYDPQISVYESRFQMFVAWVDQNSTLNDEQQEGTIQSLSPQTGRNLHIGGFKLSRDNTGVAVNVVVPQSTLGTFEMPQVGDIVWIEESRRGNSSTPTYVFSSYSKENPVPIWGSFAGDYGHLRTHHDHAEQFLATTDSDFRSKFIRSITGTRFRSFYRSNLEQGKFPVRGDAVFDIESAEINREYLINSGSSLISGGNVEQDKGKYPEPLNVPEKREKEEVYSYLNVIYRPLTSSISTDRYDLVPKTAKTPTRVVKNILKNKDFVSYQPVMDKTYLDSANFEREIPAAEEYQVALRGNNKLLIQDAYGDGEQLIITLKNQYDAQFTIVHNAERGQVRIRDHLGQGVLLDADPEAPRVISWTANKQVIEQGSVKDKGEFTYIRNGGSFGDAQTSFGTKTGEDKDSVSNQEFLMVSSSDIIGELGSRLSSGMYSLANGAFSPGVYFRNNTDPDAKSQSFSLYSQGTDLVTSMSQSIDGLDGVLESSTLTQTLTGASVTQLSSVTHHAPGDKYEFNDVITVTGGSYSRSTVGMKVGSDTITTTESIGNANTAKYIHSTKGENNDEILVTQDASAPSSITKVLKGGDPLHSITQDAAGITIKRESAGLELVVNVANDGGSGDVAIGATTGKTIINGSTVEIVTP